MTFYSLNYKNEYFFRPSSLALNGNYIYVICNSKNSYIYKINKNNFNLEGVLKIDRIYSKIISVSENRLLLLDNQNNYLNLIDQSLT